MSDVPASFLQAVRTITEAVGDRPLDANLSRFLDDTFPASSVAFQTLETLCREGVRDGWLCAREAAGIKFGRPIKPGPETKGFSVDVVEMTDIVGPHHRHPRGEIDMVMPIDDPAKFDGTPRGWKVYGPNSAHRPTVTGGSALVLYLLPGGEIEFTKG